MTATWRRLLPPALTLLLGLWTALPPLLTSGFREIPGGRDSQLVNYSLEHSYRFLEQRRLHRDFWDPPIFHPARNVAAYTDTLLSLAPFYWPWRILGFAPDSAFQIWLLTLWALDFLAFYLYLRRIFGLAAGAAAAGAFVFAFGSVRAANALHPQLIAAFYPVTALYALHRIGEPGLSRRCRQAWILVFFLALVLQAWGAVYPVFFFVFAVAAALVAAIGCGRGRARVVWALRAGAPAWICGALLAAVMTAPLAARYRVTAAVSGVRAWEEVESYLPRPVSWVLMGTSHRLWGWLYDTELVAEGRFLRTANHANGLGLAVLALAATGLYRHRQRPAVRLMVAASLLAVLSTTLLPGGFSVWRWVYEHLPGAAAIRAVGRVGLLLLIPAGLGVGLFFESLRRRSRGWPAVLFSLLIVEQAHAPAAYDKYKARARVGAIADAIGTGCRSFFVATTAHLPGIHEDAMWAGLVAGVPTVNGRYGNQPPGWVLFDKAFRRLDAAVDNPDAALAGWLERNCLDADDVCWIDSPAPGEAIRRPSIADLSSCGGAGTRRLAR